jgi:hypothetical protein
METQRLVGLCSQFLNWSRWLSESNPNGITQPIRRKCPRAYGEEMTCALFGRVRDKCLRLQLSKCNCFTSRETLQGNGTSTTGSTRTRTTGSRHTVTDENFPATKKEKRENLLFPSEFEHELSFFQSQKCCGMCKKKSKAKIQ